MKEDLRQLFLSTLDRLTLARVMPAKITCQNRVLEAGGERIELAEFKKILAVAVGKASFQMAETLAGILAPDIVSGVVVGPLPADAPLRYFVTYQGGHPYPDRHSVHAAQVVRELLTDLKPYYLVIYLISGGGSALCEQPISEEISLDDLREFNRLLVTCGANIVEMNVLRKHFSAIKGGRLAERAHPARQMTLYVSDVPPDQPSSVASGPTMPDESTVAACYEIAERLEILDRFPASIRRFFDEQRIPETPKPGSKAFEHSSWHCLLGNQDGLDWLASEARRKEWLVETDLTVDDWPLERAVDHLLARLEDLRRRNPDRTVAVLSGGELSSPVSGDGMGGRNQAFVLDCIPKIAGRNIAVVSAGSDGIDGNSPAAGALADSQSLERATRLGLDPADHARRSDSYHFFEKLGDLLVTGPTGNNIRDLRLLVAEKTNP